MHKQYFRVCPAGQSWHNNRMTIGTIPSNAWSALMGEVVRFVPKAEMERARLIREARANYERIFPPANQVSEQPQPKE
jgi:hypothetical protein